MNNSLISVVMPIYGTRADHLKNSIDSVLNQTFDDYELLCIIDPKNELIDNDISYHLSEYRDDHRVKIFKNKNKIGFINSLNYGLYLSKGDYIARLDSDDINHKERFKLQIENMYRNKIDFLGSWAELIDDNNNYLGELRTPTNFKSIKKTIIFHNPFIHSTMMYKKSCIKKIGYYNINMYGAEDYDLWIKAINYGCIFSNINYPLIKLRKTNQSLMRAKNWRKTRLNYIRVKYKGITKYGYHDPYSIMYFIFSIFSINISPNKVDYLKLMLKYNKI